MITLRTPPFHLLPALLTTFMSKTHPPKAAVRIFESYPSHHTVARRLRLVSSSSTVSTAPKTRNFGAKLLAGGAVIATGLMATQMMTQALSAKVEDAEDNDDTIQAFGKHVVDTIFKRQEALEENPIWNEISTFYRKASPQDRHTFLHAVDKHLDHLRLLEVEERMRHADLHKVKMESEIAVPELRRHHGRCETIIEQFVCTLAQDFVSDGINLTGCKCLLEYLLPFVRKLPIKVLTFSECHLSSDRLQPLPTTLEELDLSNNGLSFFRWFSEHPYGWNLQEESGSLKFADFSIHHWIEARESEITQLLKQVPNLKVLDLRNNTYITKEVEDRIKRKFPGIKVLSNGVSIYEELKQKLSVPELAVSIPTNKQEILEFGQNVVQTILKYQPTQGLVYPKDHPIWEQIRIFFRDASPENQYALLCVMEKELSTVDSNNISSLGTAKFVLNMTDLYNSSGAINLTDCRLLARYIMPFLQNARIKKLNLTRCRLDFQTLDFLPRNLHKLNLSDNAIDERAMPGFIKYVLKYERFPRLEKIDFRQNPWITCDQIIEAKEHLFVLRIFCDFPGLSHNKENCPW